jgi:hypothetical protein
VFDPAAFFAHVQRLAAPELEGRGAGTAGLDRAADYIAACFEEAGLAPAGEDGTWFQTWSEPDGPDGRPVTLRNVVGVLRGRQAAWERQSVVAGAHYDHLGRGWPDVRAGNEGQVHPGADDNASGVAVILGIARSLRGVDLDHTVLFIGFGAEERGLIGSGAYVKQPLFPLEQTVAVINFDMVGRDFFDAGASTPRTAAVVGTEGSDRARDLVRAGAAAAGLRIVETPARLLQLFRIENRTDDWWFRRHEVLSIHFSTGLHDDYHRVTDTVDKLVPGQLERIARTAAHLVRGLASSPSTFAAARE